MAEKTAELDLQLRELKLNKKRQFELAHCEDFAAEAP